MTAVLRIVVQEVERVYRLRGIAGGAIDPRFGAVTLLHRFGGSLNLNVHFTSSRSTVSTPTTPARSTRPTRPTR